MAAAIVILSLMPTPAAHALDPERSISQYKHRRWTRAEGAPSTIFAILQSRDGFLWLATGDGLFRFDGVSFERVDSEVDIEAEGVPIRLFEASNGDLWTWYRGAQRFAVYRHGKFQMLPRPVTPATVVDFVETRDGAIWAAMGEVGRPLLRYYKGRWQQYFPTQSLGLGRDSFLDFLVTADGAMWLSYNGHVLRRANDNARFELVRTGPDQADKFALDGTGRLWLVGSGGTFPLTGAGGRWPGPVTTIRYPTGPGVWLGQSIFDRDGNLWIAQRRDGIERIRTSGTGNPQAFTQGQIEDYRVADGLTSDLTNALFEDREGNIWVSTSQGLDMFQNAKIIAEPLLTHPPPSGGTDVLLAASDGQVYIAEADTLYRVPPRGAPIPVLTGAVDPNALCEGPDKTIWLVLRDRVIGLGARGRVTLPTPKIDNRVLGCGFDRADRLLLTAGVNGIFRWAGAHWDRIAPEPPGNGFYPAVMASDGAGTGWMVWSDYRLLRLTRSGDTLFALAGDIMGTSYHLRPIPGGLLVTGLRAIARLRDGRMTYADARRFPGLRSARGVVFTPEGETWSFARRTLAQMWTADVERGFKDRAFTVPTRTFDSLDGLPEGVSSQTWNALARGGDGRIWISTLGGTAWIDPARLSSNPHPPPVAIASLTAGGYRYRDPSTLALPAGTSDLTISYAALSLRMPERVQVRYRLEGHDEGWVDPGRRRQAFYTNLAPGEYRFRVIAANEDGVWNRQGATLAFTIPPAFLQSIWFKLLCAVAIAAICWVVYSLRLRQVTARLHESFTIRSAERERIARELHDTLLQGFQAITLRFQALAKGLPAGAPLRRSIEEELDKADAVLAEGRDRVLDLRAPTTHAMLADALLDTASHIVGDEDLNVQLIVEGAIRALKPFVGEELRRFGEEAIRNVVTHAEASRVELHLHFGPRELRLVVRDDGVGIPQAVMAQGERTGHLGLVGMRERAKQIGGHLVIASCPEAGTEVALALPARAAYRHRRTGLLEFLSHSWRRVTQWRGAHKD